MNSPESYGVRMKDNIPLKEADIGFIHSTNTYKLCDKCKECEVVTDQSRKQTHKLQNRVWSVVP
jgi:hypothetical protein